MPEPLLDYLKRYDDHPRLNSTMATKYPSLLELNVTHFNKKPRVRVSLMPQEYSDVLEPKMQKISSRIQDINRLKDLGWEVHINFSPLIFYLNWKEYYYNLFKEVKEVVGEHKCEVIALTNHARQMEKATEESKEIMKYSSEIKNSSGIMRYPLIHKTKLIEEFKKIYSEFFNLANIRYIF
jgi:spore photoproduct lyase